jgi:hypothetical protein
VPAGRVVQGRGSRGADGEPVVLRAGGGEECAEEGEEGEKAGEQGGGAVERGCCPGVEGGRECGGGGVEKGTAVCPC